MTARPNSNAACSFADRSALFVRGLKVRGRAFDIELQLWRVPAACATDHLSDAVNYVPLLRDLRAALESGPMTPATLEAIAATFSGVKAAVVREVTAGGAIEDPAHAAGAFRPTAAQQLDGGGGAVALEAQPFTFTACGDSPVEGGSPMNGSCGTSPLSVHCVVGVDPIERTRRQPLTLGLSAVVSAAAASGVLGTETATTEEKGQRPLRTDHCAPIGRDWAAPHSDGVFPASTRAAVVRAVAESESLTIERVAAVAARVVVSLHSEVLCVKVRVEKPEIGRLTGIDMQFASVTVQVSRDSALNFPWAPVGSTTTAAVSADPRVAALADLRRHPRCTAAEEAAQFKALSLRSGSEAALIDRHLAATIAAESSLRGRNDLRVLDLGAGFGAACRFPALAGRVQYYEAWEPNPACHGDLQAAADFLCSKSGGHWVTVGARFTPAAVAATSTGSAVVIASSDQNKSPNVLAGPFDVVLLCHSAYDAGRFAPQFAGAARALATHGTGIVAMYQRVDSLARHIAALPPIAAASVETSTIDLAGTTGAEVAMVVGAMVGRVIPVDAVFDTATATIKAGALPWSVTNAGGGDCTNGLSEEQNGGSVPSAAKVTTEKTAMLIPLLMVRIAAPPSPPAAALPPTTLQDCTVAVQGTAVYRDFLGGVKNKACRARAPIAVVFPISEAGVVAAVSWAVATGTPVSVVGGGHSDHGVVDGALLISMKNINAVSFVPASTAPASDAASTDGDGGASSFATVVCGGGATMGAVAAACDGHGVMVPLGSRPSVGVGLVLHGGIGHWSRLHGLSCDAVVEVRVVRPSALVSVAAVTAESDPALFAALCGAGSSCGVVTSIRFKTTPWADVVCVTASLTPTVGVGSVGAAVDSVASPASSFLPISGAASPTADGDTKKAMDRDAKTAKASASYAATPTHHNAVTAYFERSLRNPTTTSTDAYVTAEGITLQSFSASAQAAREAVEHIATIPGSQVQDLDSQEAEVLPMAKYTDVFDAEYHRCMPKARRDFKRTAFIPANTHATAAAIVSRAVANAPTPLCYVHVLQCGGAAAAPAPHSTVPRGWEWAAVVTGRWDDHGAESEAEVRAWLYATVAELCESCDAAVCAADLGRTAQDELLAPRATLPSCSKRAARADSPSSTATPAVCNKIDRERPGVTEGTGAVQHRCDPCGLLVGTVPTMSSAHTADRPCTARRQGPRCVIAVCGRRYCGKDWLAARIVDLAARQVGDAGGNSSTPRDGQPLVAAVRSISSAAKLQYVKVKGADFDLLESDAQYRDQHREGISQCYAEAKARGDATDERSLQMVADSAPSGTDVLIVTGMRELSIRSTLRSLRCPTFAVLVTASDAARAQRGWTPAAVDRSPEERGVEYVADWDLVVENSAPSPDSHCGPSLSGVDAVIADRVLPWAAIHCGRGLLKAQPTLAARLRSALRGIDEGFPRPGVAFRDVLSVASMPALHGAVSQDLAAAVRRSAAAAVVGIEAGGLIFAAPVAVALQLPLVVVRKGPGKHLPPVATVEHGGSNITGRGTALEVQCGRVPRGSPVAIVDDMSATGATAAAVAELILAEGAESVSLAVVADLPACRNGATIAAVNEFHTCVTLTGL